MIRPQIIKFRIRKMRKYSPRPWLVEMSSRGICSRMLMARAETWETLIMLMKKRGWII